MPTLRRFAANGLTLPFDHAALVGIPRTRRCVSFRARATTSRRGAIVPVRAEFVAGSTAVAA